MFIIGKKPKEEIMNILNYQKELDKLIANFQNIGQVPSLLLHSCCAPCSSYVLEYLSQYFEITVFYYNPNIYPPSEYEIRVKEQQDFIKGIPAKNKISFLEGDYNTSLFYDSVKGLEKEKEGGERCFKCYELRMREAAKIAKEKGFEYFTTTLSISPLKNAEKLNEIGHKLEEEYKVKHLYSDFKKKNGYKRSVELSKEYNLYRQDYCGCAFSMRSNIEQKVE